MVEECETLCSNLGVMVKGNIMCMGTKEHLVDRFLKGYILTVKILPIIPRTSKDRINKAKDYFSILFHDAELKYFY